MTPLGLRSWGRGRVEHLPVLYHTPLGIDVKLQEALPDLSCRVRAGNRKMAQEFTAELLVIASESTTLSSELRPIVKITILPLGVLCASGMAQWLL